MRRARNSKYFATVNGYHKDLPELKHFFSKHGDWINSHSRGIEYRLWKPFIILEAFKKLQYNEIVFFVDPRRNISGSINTISGEEISKLCRDYVQLATTNDLVAFEAPHIESDWTTGDTLDYFRCDDACASSPQIFATTFLIRKCPRMEAFLTQWVQAGLHDNYHLISDEPSRVANRPGFQGSRHDQSLFSCIIKMKLEMLAAIIPYSP